MGNSEVTHDASVYRETTVRWYARKFSPEEIIHNQLLDPLFLERGNSVQFHGKTYQCFGQVEDFSKVDNATNIFRYFSIISIHTIERVLAIIDEKTKEALNLSRSSFADRLWVTEWHAKKLSKEEIDRDQRHDPQLLERANIVQSQGEYYQLFRLVSESDTPVKDYLTITIQMVQHVLGVTENTESQ